MRNKKVLFITQAALIAAIYVVLTMFINAFGLASGEIQIRVSEALCILPFFTPAAIPGLFIGCLISNTLTGCIVIDIVFGSLATLLGAIGTYFLRKHKFLCTLPPVIANTVIIPLVIIYGYGVPVPFLIQAGYIAAGEVLSICVIGSILLNVLNPYKEVIFKNNEQ